MSKRWTNLPLSDEQTYSLNIVLFNITSLFNRSMWLCSWLTMQSWKKILYGCAFLNISKPVKCFNFKVLPPGNSLLHFSEIDWEISSVWIRIYQRSKCHFSTFRQCTWIERGICRCASIVNKTYLWSENVVADPGFSWWGRQLPKWVC